MIRKLPKKLNDNTDDIEKVENETHKTRADLAQKIQNKFSISNKGQSLQENFSFVISRF